MVYMQAQTESTQVAGRMGRFERQLLSWFLRLPLVVHFKFVPLKNNAVSHCIAAVQISHQPRYHSKLITLLLKPVAPR